MFGFVVSAAVLSLIKFQITNIDVAFMHQLGARADLVVTLRLSATAGVAASTFFAYSGSLLVLINIGFYKKGANRHFYSRKIYFCLVVVQHKCP